MDRRKALMALTMGLLGIWSGEAKAEEKKQDTFKRDWWEQKPQRLRWILDNTEAIELQLGLETIEIKPSEIFEALKEGR